MKRGISRGTRKELVEALADRYRLSSRSEKNKILDEFVKLTGYHRKHAIRMLNDKQTAKAVGNSVPKRIYDEAVRESLIILWEASDRICSKRLKAIIPELLAGMERHGHLQLDLEVKKKVLQVSAATIDRILFKVRKQSRRKRRKNSNGLIKNKIPVRTFADWNQPVPGFFEMDFVVHSGGKSEGSCVHTLSMTDIATGWTECFPVIAWEQTLLVESLKAIQSQLPMKILGIDSDNDSAFINETLIAHCDAHNIEFTRSRAYQKNDQAWIEQKNGAVVRRLVGYDRFEGLLAAHILSRLYQVTRLHTNFYQPSYKLKHKSREGAKVRKSYYPPTTPCKRLLEHPSISAEVKQRLRNQLIELDPLELLRSLRECQEALVALSRKKSISAENSSKSLNGFLDSLSKLWRDGEVRPTHRPQQKRTQYWRTRKDPFETVWPKLLSWFEAEPNITAKALFERLCAAHPDEFIPGQLRTLQRRVRDWRHIMAKKLVNLNYNGKEGNIRDTMNNGTGYLDLEKKNMLR